VISSESATADGNRQYSVSCTAHASLLVVSLNQITKVKVFFKGNKINNVRQTKLQKVCDLFSKKRK
jgi:hypothetical protein